jgi:hypothetical protein
MSIPTTFTTAGYTHRLIERVQDIAIYEQTRRGAGLASAYEVMRVQRHKQDQHLPSGRIIPAGTEHLPSTSDWGVQAWTLRTLPDACSKVAALLRTPPPIYIPPLKGGV